MSFIRSLFSEKRSKAIEKLWSDPEAKPLLLERAAVELPDYGGVIWRYPKEQVLALAAQARFASLDEAFCVGMIINRYMREAKDILPMITRHFGWELASRCLISLGFFREYMENRTRRYNAPSPDFYKERGKDAFRHEGWASIANHFEKWEGFLSDQFELAKY
jgi:hypothetical protein